MDDLAFVPNTAVAPDPPAFPLLMSSLGIFGFMQWRRKRKASVEAV